MTFATANRSATAPYRGEEALAQSLSSTSPSPSSRTPSFPPHSPSLLSISEPPDSRSKEKREGDITRSAAALITTSQQQPPNNESTLPGHRQRESRHEEERRRYDQKASWHTTSENYKWDYAPQHDRYSQGRDERSPRQERYKRGRTDDEYAQHDRNYRRDDNQHRYCDWEESQWHHQAYDSQRAQRSDELRSTSYSQHGSHQGLRAYRHTSPSAHTAMPRSTDPYEHGRTESYDSHRLQSTRAERYSAPYRQRQSASSGRLPSEDSTEWEQRHDDASSDFLYSNNPEDAVSGHYHLPSSPPPLCERQQMDRRKERAQSHDRLPLSHGENEALQTQSNHRQMLNSAVSERQYADAKQCEPFRDAEMQPRKDDARRLEWLSDKSDCGTFSSESRNSLEELNNFGVLIAAARNIRKRQREMAGLEIPDKDKERAHSSSVRREHSPKR